MPNCAQLQQHVLSWIQICLWGQYLCISPTRIQRTQSEVVADKRLICSSALSAINASSRFVIHFSVRVTFLPRVLTDGSTFFSIFSCTFCSTFFSSVLRECFFTHFFQYFFEYFSEYSPARVLFLVLFRVLFLVISCESTFWSNFFSFLSLLSVQLLLPLYFPLLTRRWTCWVWIPTSRRWLTSQTTSPGWDNSSHTEWGQKAKMQHSMSRNNVSGTTWSTSPTSARSCWTGCATQQRRRCWLLCCPTRSPSSR